MIPPGPHTLGQKATDNNSRPLVCTIAGASGAWDTDWPQVVLPITVVALKRGHTTPFVGNLGFDAVSQTFLHTAGASGDIVYDPLTGLWTLDPGVYHVEGALGAFGLDATDYADVGWRDEAGTEINQNWTANGSAIGGHKGIVIVDFGAPVSPWALQKNASATITVTSQVKVRMSLTVLQGGFNGDASRSYQRITQLSTHSTTLAQVTYPVYQVLAQGPPITAGFAPATYNDTIDGTALGGQFVQGDRLTMQTDIGTLVALRLSTGTGQELYYGRDQRNPTTGTRTGIQLTGNTIQHRGVDVGDGTIQWVVVERPLS